jgi:hypothetical protein
MVQFLCINMLDSLLSSLITAPACKKLSMLVVIYTRILCGDVKVVTVATALCSQKGRMIKAVSQMNPVRSLTGNYMLRLHRDRAYSRVHGITSQKRLITIFTTLRTSDLLEENSCVCCLIICFLQNGDTKLVMRGHKVCRPLLIPQVDKYYGRIPIQSEMNAVSLEVIPCSNC